MTEVARQLAPAFDAELAQSLLGKYVLVGITDCDEAGAVIATRQLHGVVISADALDGFVVRNPRNGEQFSLPPSTEHFERAPAGQYRLRGNHELVEDPDYLCTWTAVTTQTA